LPNRCTRIDQSAQQTGNDDLGGVRNQLRLVLRLHPARTPGLRFFWMQNEFSGLFGRTVDLHTPASLSRYFRSQVLAEAEDQYVAA